MKPEAMEDRLKKAFPGCEVAVIDVTGSESNFDIRISTDLLNDLNRVQKHQAVMKVFEEELKSGEVHALSIKTLP